MSDKDVDDVIVAVKKVIKSDALYFNIIQWLNN